jgi:hypothetical protein
LDDFLVVIAVKWRGSSHQDVQNDSHGPNVAPFIVSSFDDLRRQVVGSAHQFGLFFGDQFFLHILFPPVRETEVDQFQAHGVLAYEDEVLRFQVPVGYFLNVTVIDRLGNLLEDDSGVVFGEVSELVQSVEELPSLAKAEL